MKKFLKRQFTIDKYNLKAIGLGFLWGIGVVFILGLIGIQIPAIGIVVWGVVAYKYRKKFNKSKEDNKEV